MVFLLTLLALLLPRLTIVWLWMFTGWFQGVFNTTFWPLLGFIFLPLTLLWYSIVQNVYTGQWTAIPVLGMVLAVLLDLSPTQIRRRPTPTAVS